MSGTIEASGRKTVGATFDVPTGNLAGEQPPAAETLPAPASSGADMELVLATLLVQNQYEREKSARASRAAAEVGISSANATELSAMEKSADEKYKAAMISGIASVASGAITVGSAAVSYAGDKPGHPFLKRLGESGAGFAKTTEGVGQIWSAGVNHSAADADTKAAGARQSAEKLGRLASDATEEQKNAHADGQRAIDLFKQYREGIAQTSLAAIHRM